MPPVVIAGGIAAAGAIGGAVIGSSAQKKAASQANEAQQQATNAQLQLGQESMALNRDIYNSNYNMLSPWVSRGNVAGDAYSSLLGLPRAPAMTSPLQGSAVPMAGGGMPSGAGFGAGSGSAVAPHAYSSPGSGDMAYQPNGYGTAARTAAVNPAAVSGPSALPAASDNRPRMIDYVGHMSDFRPAMDAYNTAHPAGTAAGAAGGAGAGNSANSAFNNFAHSAGMDFQLQQGTNALNNLYAAHGMIQSGAAMKGINNYAQQTALNNYFMPYMNMLNGVSAQGAGAGSAVAGVGANFGNTAAGINGQMGGAIQGGADSASAAAIARGNANAQMWGAIGNQIGNVASSFVPTPRY